MTNRLVPKGWSGTLSRLARVPRGPRRIMAAEVSIKSEAWAMTIKVVNSVYSK